MRFRNRIGADDLDINLIPLIDVLLVVLIFLAATTTFTRQRAIAVALPQAAAEAATTAATIELAVSQEGRYAVGDTLVDAGAPAGLVQALRQAATGQVDPVVVIHADAMSPHQFVIAAMQAARDAGIARVQFATQAGSN